jgi:hypothetical protein
MKAKKIKVKEYHRKAINGARILIEIEEERKHYRVLDGMQDMKESYFIIDFTYEPERFFEIDLKQCYNLVAMEVAGVSDSIIAEEIEILIGIREYENA